MLAYDNDAPERRRRPRIIDTDWLVQRGLTGAIERAALFAIGPGDVVVDFGCGSKPYQGLIEERRARYIGADLGTGGDVTISETGRIPLADQCADVVTSFQVLEHVRDLEAYLGECRRLLKPSGRLVLSTHGTWLYHPHPEDHRRWTREGLLAELARFGFAPEDCQAIVGPLAFTTVLRLTGFAFALRKVPMFGGLASAALSLVMNLRAWIEDRLTPHSITKDNGCVYLTVSRKP